ncbi:hypothetical protein HY572_04445 [Candidatus Micrarchaeota archaeon]|nr:hypothetical protein [Candidatus Micrarchaeota archaeon]
MIGIYSNFEEFSKVAEQMGVKDDLRALLTLNLIFFERYEDYSIVSVRDYSDSPNNILVLSKDKTVLYSEKQITQRDFRLFKYTVQKTYGESTALTLLVLKEVLRSYTKHFDKINAEIDTYSGVKDLDKIELTTVNLRKLTVDVEDFQNLLYTLEDRKVREFRTEYLEYDYDLVLARTQHLLDRCRNHLQELRDLRSEVEVRATADLNRSIKSLTVVMMFLTIITVVLSVPNTVATVFGVPPIAALYDPQTILAIVVLSMVVAAAWGVHYWTKKKLEL